MQCTNNISGGKQVVVILVEVEHQTVVITEIVEVTTNRINIDKHKHMNNTVKLTNKNIEEEHKRTNNIIDKHMNKHRHSIDKHMNRHRHSIDKRHMNNNTVIIMQDMDICQDKMCLKLCLKSLQDMVGMDMMITTCTDKNKATMDNIVNTINTRHLINMTHQIIIIIIIIIIIDHSNSR